MSPFPQQGSASIEIRAAPEIVWELVADITRMGEWSPECRRAEWEDGATGPAVGAHFHGYNRAGSFEWDVPGIVTECERGPDVCVRSAAGRTRAQSVGASTSLPARRERR